MKVNQEDIEFFKQIIHTLDYGDYDDRKAIMHKLQGFIIGCEKENE